MTQTPQRATPLAERLKEEIAQDGPISVADYMARCLWDDQHGYYSHQRVIGQNGDFITASEISQVFGELIGLWSAVVWQQAMGAPDRVSLAEYGPGRGTLMSDALRASKIVDGFYQSVRAHLIDASDTLKAMQVEALKHVTVPLTWGTNLTSFETPAIIIANEFIDSWPIDQWVMSEDGWKQRGVGLDENGGLTFVELSESSGRSLPQGALEIRDAAPGTFYEQHDVERLAAALARLSAQGPIAALIIDYGHVEPASGDTLQAVRDHKYEDPLVSPGEADISAHVNFYSLGQACRAAGLSVDGPVLQAEFLAALGILERTSRLMLANPEKVSMIEAGVARLMAPDGMGSRFKVLGVRHPSLPPLPGFSAAAASAVE